MKYTLPSLTSEAQRRNEVFTTCAAIGSTIGVLLEAASPDSNTASVIASGVAGVIYTTSISDNADFGYRYNDDIVNKVSVGAGGVALTSIVGRVTAMFTGGRAAVSE